ncbi:hypothetical protein A6D94_04930 [Vibrio splendidus]|nr:hypothetical protein A6D94_04930 [Vibrio splendidus]
MHKNITLNNTYSEYELVLIPALQSRIYELQESFIASRDINDKGLIDNEIQALQNLLRSIFNRKHCLNRLQTIYDS